MKRASRSQWSAKKSGKGLLALYQRWLSSRWGELASSDMIRHRTRCTRCGHKGASLRHPSWQATYTPAMRRFRGSDPDASVHSLRRKLSPLTGQTFVLLLNRRIAIAEPLTFVGVSAVLAKTGHIIHETQFTSRQRKIVLHGSILGFAICKGGDPPTAYSARTLDSAE
jgi:hypothetical protein